MQQARSPRSTPEAFSRPCSACGAEAGRGCIEDGVEWPMAGMHAARAFNTSGPITVRHTGEFNEDGGAVLELEEPESETVKP